MSSPIEAMAVNGEVVAMPIETDARQEAAIIDAADQLRKKLADEHAEAQRARAMMAKMAEGVNVTFKQETLNLELREPGIETFSLVAKMDRDSQDVEELVGIVQTVYDGDARQLPMRAIFAIFNAIVQQVSGLTGLDPNGESGF